MKIFARVNLFLLILCIFQLQSSTRATFSLTLNIISHLTRGNCRELFGNGKCDTFFSIFCLRGARGFQNHSTSTSDCPHGTSSDFDDESGSRIIISDERYQGGFQMYIRALDGDLFANDFLDDIFIDLTLEANSGLSRRNRYIGTQNRVTITMTFRVDCSHNYYGPNCSVFCQEMDDDTNGHFTCNRTDGSRVCLSGFYGPECRTFCQASNSEDGGYYTCDSNGSKVCRDGFTDPENNCRENIDECAVKPCQNGGNCTDLVADFTCTCPPDYTGKTCSMDIYTCLAANCPRNSTCTESVGFVVCTCRPGFEGEHCTAIQPCASSPCKNGGTCVSNNSLSFTCLCQDGYNGSLCDVKVDECLEPLCPAESSSVQRKMSTVIVPLIIVVLVCIITFIVVIITVAAVVTRKRTRSYKASKRASAHIYQPSPPSKTKQTSTSVDNRSIDDTMESNPLYGYSSPVCDLSMSLTSTDKAKFQTDLYNTVSLAQNENATGIIIENGNGDSAPIYSTVTTDEVSLSANPKNSTANNPLYASERNSAISSPNSSIYSIPRPTGTMSINGDKNAFSLGYTALSKSSIGTSPAYDSPNSIINIPLANSEVIENKTTMNPQVVVTSLAITESGGEAQGIACQRDDQGYDVPSTTGLQKDVPDTLGYNKLQYDLGRQPRN